MTSMWMDGLRTLVPSDRAFGHGGTGRRGCLGAIRQEKQVSFVTSHLWGISGGSILQTLISEYLYMPGLFGFFMAGNAPAVNYGGA
jgi:hypothetical protein